MNTKSRLFEAFGHMHGYPYGVNRSYECDSIEEAHDLAEGDLDEVVYVREIQRTEV